ncbi:MAG: lipoprotein [SAR86 cluster bacterium]|nr:lipoprotein [SAR86 cluster bacterium]
MTEKLKKLFLLAPVLSLILITGCGHKGPLKLPEADIFCKGSFDERS